MRSPPKLTLTARVFTCTCVREWDSEVALPSGCCASIHGAATRQGRAYVHVLRIAVCLLGLALSQLYNLSYVGEVTTKGNMQGIASIQVPPWWLLTVVLKTCSSKNWGDVVLMYVHFTFEPYLLHWSLSWRFHHSTCTVGWNCSCLVVVHLVNVFNEVFQKQCFRSAAV